MGIVLKAPGILIYVVAGFWGLGLCFRIVEHALGTVMAFVSLFVLPFLLTIAPWYEGFFHGDWFPMIVIYGGGIIGSVLYGLGAMIDGQ